MDHQPEHEPMPDVPVQRPSVGAMGWMGNQAPSNETRFRPYIYRGTGEDTLTPNVPGPDPKPRKPRKPKGLAQNRRKPKARRKRYHYRTYRYEPEPRPIEDVELPEPEPKFPTHVPEVAPVLRPAPGWEPLSGAELEALLEEV